MVAALSSMAEPEFLRLIEEIRATPARHGELALLLQEDHELYSGRGSATVARMRGWLLLTMTDLKLRKAVVFLLEELDNGMEAYLVAVAANSLRRIAEPAAEFGPFLARAISNIRYHDDVVSLKEYGGYEGAGEKTTALLELLRTVEWMGSAAQGIQSEIEALRDDPYGELSPEVREAAEKAAQSIGKRGAAGKCCVELDVLKGFRSWLEGFRGAGGSIQEAKFQDQSGHNLAFADFFTGRPTLVVFFYTRCDNPQKCSLTIAKLARVQKLLAERGLAGKIRIAAITYDSGFDSPARLKSYGEARGLQFDEHSRALRVTSDFQVARSYFKLGVSFIESLVNRHRIEAFGLDRQGRIAFSFERIRWEEAAMVEKAAELLNAEPEAAELKASTQPMKAAGAAAMGGVFAFLTAFFPKCPMCWAAYMSALGMAGIGPIQYQPWLLPCFSALMLVNLACLWRRGRVQRRMGGFYLSAAGSAAVLLLGLEFGFRWGSILGIALNVAGSALVVFEEVGVKVKRGFGTLSPQLPR